jgi:hypothetical protein
VGLAFGITTSFFVVPIKKPIIVAYADSSFYRALVNEVFSSVNLWEGFSRTGIECVLISSCN